MTSLSKSCSKKPRHSSKKKPPSPYRQISEASSHNKGKNCVFNVTTVNQQRNNPSKVFKFSVSLFPFKFSACRNRVCFLLTLGSSLEVANNKENYMEWPTRKSSLPTPEVIALETSNMIIWPLCRWQYRSRKETLVNRGQSPSEEGFLG